MDSANKRMRQCSISQRRMSLETSTREEFLFPELLRREYAMSLSNGSSNGRRVKIVSKFVWPSTGSGRNDDFFGGV